MDEHINAAVDAASTAASAATVSKFGTISGATVAISGSFLGEYTIALLGLIATVVFGAGGLLVTWYYKRESNRREEELHQLRIAQIKMDANAF